MKASTFLSAEPTVELLDWINAPHNTTTASAKTCYSHELVRPNEVTLETQPIWNRIKKSIFDAGHHTTFQHSHFVFLLDGISRQLIWSFFHSHPFYNSEQVSQRYRTVRPENVVVPDLQSDDLNRKYRQTIAAQMDAYQALIELLLEQAGAAYFDLFPKRKGTKKGDNAIRKKTQEIARYILPIATKAHMYHSINGLTLHRYSRLAHQLDVPTELRLVVRGMVERVKALDPDFLEVKEVIPLEETLEYQNLQRFSENGRLDIQRNRRFIQEFDQSLEGHISKLIDWPHRAEECLGEAVRGVLGFPQDTLSDEEAIELVLNPAKNAYYSEPLTLTTLSKLTRALNHVSFTFRKKLSHTADSQDQRHRTIPGSRPILMMQYTGQPDYITPDLIAGNSRAHHLYEETMGQTWEAVNELLDAGAPEEFAFYLLPNALPIRFIESGNLLHLHHKFVQRECYNAQKEIWKATIDEVSQIAARHPMIGRYFGAPCHLNKMAGASRICPEGIRFCGVKVWNLTREEYRRVI